MNPSWEFSQSNHLQGRFQDHPTGGYVPGGTFLVRMGECTRTPGTALEEAIKAARTIASQATRPLWLCLSGGVDSEAMAYAFLKAKVPFKAAIMRFKKDLNWFDIRHAVDYCKENQIQYEFFDLDIDEFFHSGKHIEYAHLYRCISPQLATHLELLKRIDGCPILSWNVTSLHLTDEGRVWIVLPRDLYFCYERFFRCNRREGIPFFFLYSPELAFSFLRQPMMQDILFQRGSMKGRFVDYPVKCQAYRDGGFPVQNREDKFTGFEEVKKHFQKIFPETPDAFDTKFRRPLMDLYPGPEKFLIQLSTKFLKA